VKLQSVRVELGVPRLPGRAERSALLFDVAVEDAVRVALVRAELLLLRLLLPLDLSSQGDKTCFLTS